MSEQLTYREAATIVAQRMNASEFNAAQLLNDAIRLKTVQSEEVIPGMGMVLYVSRQSLDAWIDDLLGVAHPETGLKSSPVSPARKKGQKPVQTNRVLAEMRRYGAQALESWTQEAMAAQFNASRDTCMKALNLLRDEEAA